MLLIVGRVLTFRTDWSVPDYTGAGFGNPWPVLTRKRGKARRRRVFSDGHLRLRDQQDELATPA
jgi:hypothetical protein